MEKSKIMALPDYYSELGPFLKDFNEGHPILCYHKIARPPAKARIKGLYLDPDLFLSQMNEISQAAFVSTLPNDATHSNGSSITITFDDGFLNNLTEAVPLMEQTGIRAV